MVFSKTIFYKIFLFLSLLSISSNAQESSISEFIKLANSNVGNYEIVGKPTEFCRSGSLTFINKANPRKGLTLSNKIFLGPFVDDKIEVKEKGYCTISEKYEYSKNSVRQVTNVHSCDQENVSDESTSTQELHFNKNRLTYKSLESGLECHFSKVSSKEVKK